MHKLLALFFLMIAVFSFMLVFCFAEEDSLSFATYYPAPYGNYREMRAMRMAIGDNYIKTSEYDWETGAANLINASADLVVEGDVGIGTSSPEAKLDVNGAIKASGIVVPGGFANDPTDPDKKIEGAVYFNTTIHKHRVYQNGAWSDISSSASQFSFKLTGYPGSVEWYIGNGKYESSTGKFSGRLQCDPTKYTLGIYCGRHSDSPYWCGTDASCARTYALGLTCGCSPTTGYEILVTNVSIDNVTQMW